MATREFPIVGDSLALGFRFQRHWDQSMANAFFCGELGAGIFLAGFLYDSTVAMIAGVIVTGVLKTYFHLSHMGVPGRSWRAMLRPDRSWISRGLISIVFFAGAGVLYIAFGRLGLLETLGLANSSFALGLLWLFKWVAVIAAMVVMVYHGFAIADSQSIAFWNTGLMPVSSFCYSLLAGLVVTMNLDPNAVAVASQMPPLHTASLIMLILTTLVLISMLQGANRGSPGAKMSLKLLLKDGPYVKWFYGAVVLAGIVLPFALLLLAAPSRIGDLLIAVGVLGGYYAFRSLVFRVGLYDPIISFAPES